MMKKLFIALLAVAAIAACEKEDTTEWGKSETLVRKYRNFDAAAIPDFITRGVLLSEQEFRLEDRCVWFGHGSGLDGGSRTQYIFFDDNSMWNCIAYDMSNPSHGCHVRTWEYDKTARTLHTRIKGYTYDYLVEALLPDDRVILNDGQFRLIMRLHSDRATIDRFMATYGPLANAQD